MQDDIDVGRLIAQAESDAQELARVLEAETAALDRFDLDGLALLADEKRAYGQRLERGCGLLRRHGQALSASDAAKTALEPALQRLAQVARRNMEALSVWRDAGQRVLGVIAEVAIDRAETAVGYGPGGRRVGSTVPPLNLNAVY